MQFDTQFLGASHGQGDFTHHLFQQKQTAGALTGQPGGSGLFQ
jgi:hypothetical protein